MGGDFLSGFVPRPYSKQQITVRLDESVIKRIDELSSKLKISRSALINQCIEYALEAIKTNK